MQGGSLRRAVTFQNLTDVSENQCSARHRTLSSTPMLLGFAASIPDVRRSTVFRSSGRVWDERAQDPQAMQARRRYDDNVGSSVVCESSWRQ